MAPIVSKSRLQEISRSEFGTPHRVLPVPDSWEGASHHFLVMERAKKPGPPELLLPQAGGAEWHKVKLGNLSMKVGENLRGARSSPAALAQTPQSRPQTSGGMPQRTPLSARNATSKAAWTPETPVPRRPQTARPPSTMATASAAPSPRPPSHRRIAAFEPAPSPSQVRLDGFNGSGFSGSGFRVLDGPEFSNSEP